MKAMVPSSLRGASVGRAGGLEGFGVGAVRQHAIVQRKSAGEEALRLGVIGAVDQAHELAHDVHVIPGRPERVFGDHPAVRENHEIDVGGAGRAGGGGQHGEDRGIGVVEQQRADRGEASQIVFVGRVIAVPGNDVERRVIEFGDPQSRRPILP